MFLGPRRRRGTAHPCAHDRDVSWCGFGRARPLFPNASCRGTAPIIAPTLRSRLKKRPQYRLLTPPHFVRTTTLSHGVQTPARVVLELCHGASTAAPAQCYVRATSMQLAVGTAQRASVCKGASIEAATAPATCLETSLTRGMLPEYAVNACRGVTGMGVVHCVTQAPSYLSSDEKVRLCRAESGRVSVIPAACAAVLPPRFRAHPGMTVKICAGAVSTMAAHCAAAVPM